MSNELTITNQNQVAQPFSSQGMALVSRQAQEVQAAMVVAKRFPRDENEAYSKIMLACQRKSLAEQACYEYKRGGAKVEGPSIRLAETIARAWGNIDYGIIELEQKDGKSEMMAYAWDLETNTRITRIFSVKHWRDTKTGGYALTDSRDIYEITANLGARRVRACILQVIPGDIVDAAVEQCKKTLIGAYKEPLADRIRSMITAFEKDFQITKEMLENYIGCKADVFSENDFIRLRNVYKSLRDGMSTREELFDIPRPTASAITEKSPFEGAVKADDKKKGKKDESKGEAEQLEIDYSGTPFEDGEE